MSIKELFRYVWKDEVECAIDPRLMIEVALQLLLVITELRPVADFYIGKHLYIAALIEELHEQLNFLRFALVLETIVNLLYDSFRGFEDSVHVGSH